MEDGGYDPWSIRRAFCVRRNENNVVMPRLYYDFSQIELRVLSHYTKDPIMVETYLRNGDIHHRTQVEVGALVGGEPIPRRAAKVINFGLSYCMSAGGLSRQAGIPIDDAERFLNAFFERYARVALYRKAFWAKVRSHGNQFQNMFGRPRRLPDLSSEIGWQRKRAERQAFGTLIQGTAAELTKISIVRIHQWLKETGLPAKLVSTVHDEIWIDCDTSCLTRVAPQIKRLMEDFPEFHPIPILVDAKYSDTDWSNKKPLPL
jgi:DNA polymerase-1